MQLEEKADNVTQRLWGAHKQLFVFFGDAGIGTQGWWGATAVLQACRKIREWPNSDRTTDRQRGKMVIVDEFRTSRVSSTEHAPQPCELPRDQPRPSNRVPPAGQVIQQLVRPAWSQRHAKYVWCHEVPPNHPPPAQDPSPPPAQELPPPTPHAPPAHGPLTEEPPPPYPGPTKLLILLSWLDRDTNGCLNFQSIGESMQRPLELCNWDDLEALPPIGKEYQQRYKLVNDRLPKGRQRLHRAAEYRRGY
ncbi:hypothetical protein QJQ45_003225 [Haematococcus lacustris]|nr:hypothetical protein QJQ45_003225 [Haematococcus lacustris]